MEFGMEGERRRDKGEEKREKRPRGKKRRTD
jgi:hypothetical protein